MTRQEAKALFKTDLDSYGKPKAIMHKIDQIYDEFESKRDEVSSVITKITEHAQKLRPTETGHGVTLMMANDCLRILKKI